MELSGTSGLTDPSMPQTKSSESLSLELPTDDFAKIGKAFETTIVLSLMELSGTSGLTDPSMLHKRNRLSRFRSLMHKVHSMLSLEVQKTTVCVWFELCMNQSPAQKSQMSMCFRSYSRFCFLIHLKSWTDSTVELLLLIALVD